ncbi:MAG TPA: lipid A deacylase LpxR family protein, partial [Puia sp.]|nr:lipid A deacylase LpxR family protein [Puia sp.]
QSLTADAKINAIPQNPADILEYPARTFRKPIDRKRIDRKPIALKTADTLRWIFRISEDNDFLNARGCGTDDAYTNGTRLDYFYQPRHPSKDPIDKILPKAGAHSVNTYGWGIMQLMYTPENITDSAYQPNDYPWSGALVATHTLYSYNPVQKYDFRTELDLGVIGPASLACQTQTGFHKLIHYFKPRGWSHQYPNDLLANVDITAERQLAGNGSNFEWIGGSQLSVGTMMNSLTVYPLIRIGKMNPYFKGWLSQYASTGRNNRRHKNWQLYFICRPELQLIATEAVLQGGMFTRNPNLAAAGAPAKPQQQPPAPQPYHPINHAVLASNFGVVAGIGDFSISFNQNSSTAMMKGLYSHEFGNISLYFGW